MCEEICVLCERDQSNKLKITKNGPAVLQLKMITSLRMLGLLTTIERTRPSNSDSTTPNLGNIYKLESLIET